MRLYGPVYAQSKRFQWGRISRLFQPYGRSSAGRAPRLGYGRRSLPRATACGRLRSVTAPAPGRNAGASRGPRGWARPAPHEGGPMASRSRRRRCGRTRGRGARGGAAARGRRWSRGGPRPVGPATPPAASGATGRCGRMGPRSDDGAARSARGRTACGRRSPWIRSTTICASRRRAYARHGRRPAVAATDARHGGGTDGARLDGARRAALPRATMATPSAGVRKRAQERARWMARSCHGGGCPHGQLGGGHEGCKGSWDARPTLS
jgi:hypothetical protein